MKSTLCFIKKNDRLLLVNRNEEPWSGIWSAFYSSVLPKETKEKVVLQNLEKNLKIKFTKSQLQYKGQIKWTDQKLNKSGSVFLYLIIVDDFPDLIVPKEVTSGLIAWKKIDWLLNGNNQGVNSFLIYPTLNLTNSIPQLYEYSFENSEISLMTIKPIGVK